ncbi:MAG: hypothetical protein RI907_2178 [Pseudomonadota bacterium]|jgi:uncharacterized protein YegL
MALTLNLEKSAATLKLCLEKAGVTKLPELELAFILDVSGSFEDEHRKGITNDLLTRLVPWGLTFDPDRKLDVITFSDGEHSVQAVGAVNADNYSGFVAREIIDQVKGWNGGTDYSYALEQALRDFGWMAGKQPGLFGRLMGRKAEVRERKRSLVIMVTDGDNFDKDRTMSVLRSSEQRGDAIYFLFLGVSNQGSKFPFLEKIGDAFNNTGYVGIKNLRSFVQKSDEELNDSLLTGELKNWLKAA